MNKEEKFIKTIHDLDVVLLDVDKIYTYQPELTTKLDNFSDEIDQNLLNEIVLWKINRYAWINEVIINKLKELKCKSDISDDSKKEILQMLLSTKGIDIAMASTILRFINSEIFQIIDQRAYRVIYGKTYNSTTKKDIKIDIYLNYLKDLKEVCNKYDIPFKIADRWLYSLDKRINKEEKIRY